MAKEYSDGMDDEQYEEAKKLEDVCFRLVIS
jgi:hypothetical protein